jgi:hypothetical protein
LKGLYDFTLEWTPDRPEGQDDPGLSLFTASEKLMWRRWSLPPAFFYDIERR